MSENPVLSSINAFSNLVGCKYDILLGRKGKTTDLRIYFEKDNFYHLAGLHYLKDRPNLNGKRSVIFDKIKNGRISANTILTSMYYDDIADRLELAGKIKDILNSEYQIFSFDIRRNIFSRIRADFVIKTSDNCGTIYLFLICEKDGMLRCCSIFYDNRVDYALNQTRMSVLKKQWQPRHG